MPKFPTYPTLYDEVLQISMTKLKEWQYLNPEQTKSGTITWSRNGNTTGSISIHVNTFSEHPYIELDYKYRDEPRNYKIQLVSISSNLGKGLVWYFLCPKTNKRCRKLYSIGGYFMHREAFNGCYYEKQTRSRQWRETEKLFDRYYGSERAYDQIYKKYFKKYYAGKPTKRYKKLLKMIEESESIPYEVIERAMIK